MRIPPAVFLLLLCQDSVSAEWMPIEGIYAVTAENHLDHAQGTPNNTHYRLQLSGNSAKDLYQAMKVKPAVDECTGGLAKNISQMQCLYFKLDDKYQCHFSINVLKQKIDYGVAC